MTTDQGGLVLDTVKLRQQLTDHLFGTHDDEHEHDRALARTQLVFKLFYDDEPTEPDQAIRDALTDLIHTAADLGVDFEGALIAATRLWTTEREE